MKHQLYNKKDKFSLKTMTDIFIPKDGYFWFIECLKTNQWISVDGKTLTNDPNFALIFRTQIQAITYCNNNSLPAKDYTQTEHQFI